jgi:Ca-activated chloride channel family protein
MRRFTNPNPAVPQPAQSFAPLKGAGFSPYIDVAESNWALAPEILSAQERICHPERSEAQSKDLLLSPRHHISLQKNNRVPRVSFLRPGIALASLLLLSVTLLPAQTTPPKPPPLTVDRDPVRSPDADITKAPTGDITKQGGGFVVHADVEEVSLNVTVLDGKGQIVQDLKKDDFKVLEDGIQQNLLSFQHADIPVSIGLVIDNSGSMYKKRPSVNKSALDLILASNPKDEAFVVNFADDAYIDQDLTSDANKLKDGLAHIESRGGTALYDAVVASADKLAADARRPKQVIVIITDGEDNASTLNLEQAIRRVQQLSGPVIYSIGLLFGDEMSRGEVRHARRALEMLSGETGGIAFFPKSLDQVDEIAAEVARDIRSQYTLAYHSTKPTSDPGFRKVTVIAQSKGDGKLNVRTRTGYFPSIKNAKPAATPADH